MRIHATAALVVIVISLFAKLNKTDIIMLAFAISLVIISEMINTAIEKSIDLFTDKYHPLAKISKDVAAGAVFVAASNAVVIGYLVFFNKVLSTTETVITKILRSELHITAITILVILILVVLIKMRISSSKILQGGMPSGHAAVAFSLVTAAALLSENILVSFFAFLLGFLVIQSRVESKIHSVIEVVLGAALGVLVTLLVYNYFII
jgi:diacylglycerol kinase (ATP)